MYMAQPPEFVDANLPHHVYKLHKEIYGKKTGSSVWFQYIRTFVIFNSFIPSIADSSMFIYQNGCHMMIFLLYVEDIVLTGNSSKLLQSFITKLGTKFEIKDLDDLHYFHELETTRDVDGLYMSQTKYTLGLLRPCHMLDCKSSPTTSYTMYTITSI